MQTTPRQAAFRLPPEVHLALMAELRRQGQTLQGFMEETVRRSLLERSVVETPPWPQEVADYLKGRP